MMEDQCVNCGSTDIYRARATIYLTNDNGDEIAQRITVYYCGDCGCSDCDAQ